ncbi:MAG: glycosyltransferase family 2 protein [Holophagales bacterium]|nr:glycosyltransferase family 2 protein [Holophagales bacterium]
MADASPPASDRMNSADPSGAAETDRPEVPRPDISVVIPCLNEIDSVATCVEKALRGIEKTGLRGEVVVADNGSTDGSGDAARAAGARVVKERRKGYGSAYLRGFDEARGRFIVMGDADDTYDFLDIPRFVEPLAEGRADMVMGNRLGGTILPGAMPWSHRWIGNPILSGMLRLLFHTKVSDSHCGMRSFTREAYEAMGLHTTGMELASEIVVNALRAKLRIEEIPITYYPREGESKLEGFRDAWRHVRFMLLFSPSYLFLFPGLLLILFGVASILLLGGGPREMFGRVWDYHVLLFGCLALVLGHNLVIFDTLAKRFSITAGFLQPGRWLDRRVRFFTLERGLALGVLVFLAGLGLELKIVWDWAQGGYGELRAVRGVTLGMTAMLLGAQTIFASFLFSLTLIQRR